MRSAKNFSPEWGYLAPAPSLARTARVVLVATAIGATAGAGVVLSLVERPAEAQKTPIAARAIVTSVRETAVPSVAPTVGTAAVSSPAIAVSAVPAPAPVTASAPPPALKPSASARTTARAIPQAVNPPPAAPPSTVATATPALVPTASVAPAPSAPAPFASATSLSASNSAPAPAPATAAATANANVSVAAASSSTMTAAIGSGVAPQAADAAPVSVPESPSIIAPETLSPKKAKRHTSSKAAPGLRSILRRLFVAHSGRSYYPHSANGGL
jgi:hypothetical protein